MSQILFEYIKTLKRNDSKMEYEKLSIAQCLHKHPVLKEKNLYKMKYINVLEYFTNLYSSEDDFAKGILQVYKNKFIASTEYQYSEIEIRSAFKKATQYKLKGFKLFTYRYNLLFDCLFINAFNEPKKAAEIAEKIKMFFKPRYYAKIDRLYALLYNGGENTEFIELGEQLECWNLNKKFQAKELNRVLITANMSAGKSTLINALVGKKVSRTGNEACTAKIHYVLNKPYEDRFVYEWDGHYNLNADYNDLMDDEPENTSRYIGVGTYFNSDILSQKRFMFINTPGVDYCGNPEHAAITKSFISNHDYDCVIYVTAPPIESDADEKHLKYIYENCNGKRVIFVINKLDKYNSDEDSIDRTIINFYEYLKKIGFDNPIVCPVSAYAATLAKKKMSGNELNGYEKNVYKLFLEELKKEEYNMKKYYDYEYGEDSNREDKEKVLLNECGLAGLEKILINI